MLQNLELVSESPQQFLSLNMKFLFSSLIVAAVAAIAGSLIAAPSPLHARAMEQVNSFDSEHDVDIYIRQPLLKLVDHHNDHYITARVLRRASMANHKAAEDARNTADVMPESGREGWLRQSKKHTAMANWYADMYYEHMAAIQEPTRTELHREVHSDRNNAFDGIKYAESTSRDAQARMSKTRPVHDTHHT